MPCTAPRQASHSQVSYEPVLRAIMAIAANPPSELLAVARRGHPRTMQPTIRQSIASSASHELVKGIITAIVPSPPRQPSGSFGLSATHMMGAPLIVLCILPCLSHCMRTTSDRERNRSWTTQPKVQHSIVFANIAVSNVRHQNLHCI